MALTYFVAAVALVCLLPVTLQEELKLTNVTRTALVKECQQKTRASNVEINKLRNGGTIPSSKEGMCMLECFFNKINVMQNGRFNGEGYVAVLTPLVGSEVIIISKIKVIAKHCAKKMDMDMVPGDKCQTAKVLLSCTESVASNIGFDYPNIFFKRN